MENIEKCECWIGVRYDYENTDLVTLADLKENIESHNGMVEFWQTHGFPEIKKEKLNISASAKTQMRRKSSRLCIF